MGVQQLPLPFAPLAALAMPQPPPGLELQQPAQLCLDPLLVARQSFLQLQLQLAKAEPAKPRACKRSLDPALVEEHNPDDLVLLQLHDSRSAAKEMAQLAGSEGELGPWFVDPPTSPTAAAQVFEAELKGYHIVTRGRHISRIRQALPRPTHKKTRRVEVLEVKAAPPRKELVLLTVRDANTVRTQLEELCGLQLEGPWFHGVGLTLEAAQRLFDGVQLQKHHVILPASLEPAFREALPPQWRSDRRLKELARKPWV